MILPFKHIDLLEYRVTRHPWNRNGGEDRDRLSLMQEPDRIRWLDGKDPKPHIFPGGAKDVTSYMCDIPFVSARLNWGC